MRKTSKHHVTTYRAACLLLGVAMPAGWAADARADESTNHYVWADSPSETAPYTNWLTAAHAIQPALDAAGTGDTVWVTNGVYTLTAQLNISKTVSLIGVNGARSTIIDGNYPVVTNRCLQISDNKQALVEGITFTNGCSFKANGGGVLLGKGSTLRRCTIAGNSVIATNGFCYGGGVFINGSGYVLDCAVSGNFMTNNTDSMYGGGISTPYNGGRGAVISNCFIFGNTVSPGSGGGLRNDIALVVNCVISNNFASGPGSSGRGGGIYAAFYGTNRNCAILNNSSKNGSVYSERGGVFEGCLFAGNIGGFGAGMVNEGSAYVRNCTVAGNPGGPLLPGSQTVIENTISYYNGTENTAAGAWTNCCVNKSSILTIGTGNITNAPLFADTNAANFRLTRESPCVNAGAYCAWMDGARDLDGKKRVSGGRVDMGAYEFVFPPPGTFYSLR